MEHSILPNATLFPNFLTDEVMPLVSSDEWKLIHFGVVACLRLNRGDDSVSITQFVQGTGLPEDRVRECLGFLCDTAQVFLRQDRPRKPHVYRLNLEIAAVQVETLEQRKKGALAAEADGAEMEGQEAGDPPAQRDSVAPAARGRGRGAEPFPEHPSVEIRLDGEEGPVTKRLRQSLPAPERAAFDHLLRHYPRAKREGEDSEVWGLFRLWQTYGFACLNNSLQGAHAATDLSEINRICLLDEITKVYEARGGAADAWAPRGTGATGVRFPFLDRVAGGLPHRHQIEQAPPEHRGDNSAQPETEGHGRSHAAGAATETQGGCAACRDAGGAVRRGLAAGGLDEQSADRTGDSSPAHLGERLLRCLGNRHCIGAEDTAEAARG
jgi:hypothetical protein